MMIRKVEEGEKECCANCTYLGIDRPFGYAKAVCRKDGHEVLFAISRVCNAWEVFV